MFSFICPNVYGYGLLHAYHVQKVMKNAPYMHRPTFNYAIMIINVYNALSKSFRSKHKQSSDFSEKDCAKIAKRSFLS